MSASRGRAGELQVAGELLRQDWGVYFPFVDKGIDLVTEINGRFISIQVKESKLYRQGVYWQQVFKKPFDNIKGENTFLIFVLRREKETNYLIIPSLWFDKHSEEFYYDAKNRRWFLYFKLVDGKASETRQSQLDLTPFLNNWEQLKHVANKRAPRNVYRSKIMEG